MISKKELIAVLFIITALVCSLNAGIFGNNMPTTSSYEQLGQQCVSISTAYLCMIYALSTWLYHSNYSEPRQHMRYVLLAMLVIMILSNFVAMILVIRTQFFNSVNDGIDIETVFTDFDMVCRIITVVFMFITILLLVAVLVLMSLITHEKRKRVSQRPL